MKIFLVTRISGNKRIFFLGLTCAKFQQNLLNSMVVGTRQSFQFFRQNTCFLENNRALSKFLYWILHYLGSTTKLYKNQSIKPNFILTTLATLSNYVTVQEKYTKYFFSLILFFCFGLRGIKM